MIVTITVGARVQVGSRTQAISLVALGIATAIPLALAATPLLTLILPQVAGALHSIYGTSIFTKVTIDASEVFEP